MPLPGTRINLLLRPSISLQLLHTLPPLIPFNTAIHTPPVPSFLHHPLTCTPAYTGGCERAETVGSPLLHRGE